MTSGHTTTPLHRKRGLRCAKRRCKVRAMLLGQDPFRNALGGITAGRLSPPDGPLAAGPTVQCITRAFHGWWGRVSTNSPWWGVPETRSTLDFVQYAGVLEGCPQISTGRRGMSPPVSGEGGRHPRWSARSAMTAA